VKITRSEKLISYIISKIPILFMPINTISPPMKVIGLTGMPGSGKTAIRDILEGKGWKVVRMGDFVFEEVKRQGLKLDPENIGNVANQMRSTHGKDIWAKRTVDHIRSEKMDKVLIDGVRSNFESDYFKETLGDEFLMIAVLASPEIRKERILSRGREDDGSEQSFFDRDAREIKWGIGQVIAQADLTFRNEGALEDIKNWVEGEEAFQ